MRRKTLGLVAVGGVLTILCGVAAVRWAATQAPDFYEQALADPPAPAVRREAAREFARQTAELVQELRYSRNWEEEFTQTEVNAWLAEELPREYGDRIPKGVADPRVQFDNGLVRIAFRLASKSFEGVVNLDLRPSVPEPNRLDIRVESLAAGLLPLSPGSFTDDVSKQLDLYRVPHEWRVEDGAHVLAVMIVPTRGDNPVLERIAVGGGSLRIAGRRDRARAITMHAPAAPRRL